MVTISICMIVKNEEKHLARCLDSIADLAEELIIVDTGSTDRTKEIAAKYNATIYDFKWNGDFSEARNFSFSKATKEYIYQADADEVLDETNRMRFKMLKQAMDKRVDIVQMFYCNQLEFNTVYNQDKEYRPKMYKRLREFYFEDPIHEQVRLTPVIFDSDVEILHMPDMAHSQRDFAGFLMMIKKGLPVSKRLHNMYATELVIAGEDKDFLDAKEFFTQSVTDENRTIEEIKEAALILVKAAHIENDISAMFKYSLKDVATDASSEMCYEIGEYFYEQGDYNEAALWYHNSIYECKPIVYEKIRDVYAKEQLANCYEMFGNHAEAKKIRDELE